MGVLVLIVKHPPLLMKIHLCDISGRNGHTYFQCKKDSSKIWKSCNVWFKEHSAFSFPKEPWPAGKGFLSINGSTEYTECFRALIKNYFLEFMPCHVYRLPLALTYILPAFNLKEIAMGDQIKCIINSRQIPFLQCLGSCKYTTNQNIYNIHNTGLVNLTRFNAEMLHIMS